MDANIEFTAPAVFIMACNICEKSQFLIKHRGPGGMCLEQKEVFRTQGQFDMIR
jgi:hypothetical protein